MKKGWLLKSSSFLFIFMFFYVISVNVEYPYYSIRWRCLMMLVLYFWSFRVVIGCQILCSCWVNAVRLVYKYKYIYIIFLSLCFFSSFFSVFFFRSATSPSFLKALCVQSTSYDRNKIQCWFINQCMGICSFFVWIWFVY